MDGPLLFLSSPILYDQSRYCFYVVSNDREIEMTKSRASPVELFRAVCRSSRISAFEFAACDKRRVEFRRLVKSGKGTVEANA